MHRLSMMALVCALACAHGTAIPQAPAAAAASTRPQDLQLFAAVKSGDAAAVNAALAAGGDVNAANENGQQPLLIAASQGIPAVIDALLAKGAPVEGQSRGGMTPLMGAAGFGQIEAAQKLLAAGAKATTKNPIGWTALNFSCLTGQKASMVELLAKAGADVNTPDLTGMTPFLICAKGARTKESRAALVREQAALFAPSSPYLAQGPEAWSDGAEMLQALFLQGAKPDVTDKLGQTAAHWAAEGQDPAVFAWLKDHVGLDAASQASQTPLHRAVIAAKADNIRGLIKAGANPNPPVPETVEARGRMPWQATPLVIAAENGCLECVKALVEGGADVNKVFEYSFTDYSQAETMNWAKGAKERLWITKTTQHRYTALSIAQEHNHPEIVEYLKSKGAKEFAPG